MVHIDELLPRERTPLHYQNLVHDPRIDQEGLRMLAVSAYPFVRSEVARCPQADATTLGAVSLDSLNRWTRNKVLADIAGHPHADRTVLRFVLGEVVASLNQPGGRPFAAALALATRPELTEAEVLTLTQQPNASRRMRRGVRRALSQGGRDRTGVQAGRTQRP
ncbi:hypothetical protein OHA21_14385 [Actinoplanes sp. NBC_00393]|uniref:hypothetical protein n=1 Tax=Actinoplanes sp. NBC_00393 TaxID=2975953 RepID=UPI002E1E05B3